MTVMSFLRLTSQHGSRKLMKVSGGVQQQSVRDGHGRTMEIHPSLYSWNKTKDNVHFYFFLGFIPLAAFATYENLRYGRSILTETPENYEPEFYEYERHPVTRFLCWWTGRHPRYDFERVMDARNNEAEKQMLRKIEKQVRAVMKIRGDHKSFYYQPVWQSKNIRMKRENVMRIVEREGVMDSHHILSSDLEHHQAPLQPAERTQYKRAGGPGFADDME